MHVSYTGYSINDIMFMAGDLSHKEDLGVARIFSHREDVEFRVRTAIHTAKNGNRWWSQQCPFAQISF